MNADTFARALGGRKAGQGWMARCPAHNDRKPSLSISVGDGGKVLVRCHAGCDQRQVIAALRSRGLWDNSDHRRGLYQQSRPALNDLSDRDDTKRTRVALRLWEASSPAIGTPAEVYLRSRGLHLPSPVNLRFHAGLKHPTGEIWPAMVALVTRGADNAPMAIHRAFLAHDGAAKAPVDPAKMMLGLCRGGAVRLGPIGETLVLAEGIETALSVQQATGISAWACLSTSGLKSVVLPAEATTIIIAADGDEPGIAAAEAAAKRLTREGRKVKIAKPPADMDFNDVLRLPENVAVFPRKGNERHV